jgi:mannitol/fructose-specific phosphotransferase system IIA component (Ntr-type)
MESQDKIKINLPVQKIGYFIVAIFFLYIIGSIISWGISVPLEKSNQIFRDPSSGAMYCLTPDEFVRELVDFYNNYNLPRWIYLGLLKENTLTTIFVSVIIISVLIWLCSITNKLEINIAPDIEEEKEKIAGITGPELSKLNKDFIDLIILDLEGKTKENILWGIAKFAKDKGLVKDEKSLYESFLEKEKRGTSAIGDGVALPEASFVAMSRPYAFIICRTKEPVDFDSFDGKPVRIVLASLKRDKVDLFDLKPMLYIFRLLKSEEYKGKFLDARTEDDIYRLWKEMTSADI